MHILQDPSHFLTKTGLEIYLQYMTGQTIPALIHSVTSLVIALLFLGRSHVGGFPSEHLHVAFQKHFQLLLTALGESSSIGGPFGLESCLCMGLDNIFRYNHTSSYWEFLPLPSALFSELVSRQFFPKGSLPSTANLQFRSSFPDVRAFSLSGSGLSDASSVIIGGKEIGVFIQDSVASRSFRFFFLEE
ncbi:hypothetical protein Tco_0825583 [Tanacetum coccineum]